MPFILALRRQRQANFGDLKSSLVYRVSSKVAGTALGDLVAYLQ